MPAMPPRSRVVMATTKCFPDLGGIESHIQEVAPRVARAGYDVRIVATDRTGRLPRHDDNDGVAVRRYRAFPRRRDYYASPGLFAGLLRDDYELLHVQGIHTLVPPLAMMAAILRRKPFVLTFHTGGSSSRLRTQARATQFRLLAPLLRRAAVLVAVSHYEADRFERILGRAPGTIRVIRNGGTLPEPAAPVAVDPDLIVSVGRLERYKGHHRAIAALPYVVKTRPDARLRILGAGPYEAALRALAAELGVADRVEITVVAPGDRAGMSAELARAGVMTLLSDYEAHPVAVMEALALARPVVVLETSGLTELARAGWVRGVAADASDEVVAEALVAQLADPIRADRERLPTWQTCVAELDVAYRDALTAGGR